MVLILCRLRRALALLAIMPGLLAASDNADVLGRCQFLSGGRFTYYKTDHFWNRDGDRVKSFNNFKQYKGDLCLAFGVTDRDTLHLQGTYARIDEAANGSMTGFGDTELSWKHFLGRRWNHYWTGRVQAIIPSGGRKFSLRYGRWGGEFDLFMKRELCFYGRPLWYNLGAGYRLYKGYPSDQVRGFFEAGYRPLDYFSILVDGKLDYGVFNGTKNDPPNLILYNADYRLLKGRLYGVLRVHRCAYLYAGGFSHLWGRNVGTGGGFFVGSYLSF